VVDEKEMRPGRWLRSVLCVYFSALTLMVGWQEGHGACRNRIPLILNDSFLEQAEEDPRGTGRPRFTCKKTTIKQQ